jgi:polyisoprenoid-binding protein YceI
MKKKATVLAIASAIVFVLASFIPATKLVSSKAHIKFFSTTPAEDIESNNYKAVSVIDLNTGDVVFTVPMQSFEFEKSLMQKHFNSKKFLHTKRHPKAKMTAKITNLDSINLDKEGDYTANIEGELTIKGVTKPINEQGTITIKDQTVEVNSTFDVTLADYGITFSKGKPATNIAKTVEVTVFAEYQPE